ncbi:unnamed protein product [Rotaria socialis]|uniref:Transport and Golgi organization protein 1 n=7 Tax=Rotaria socialis TaxID=392032 RepID=A0A817SC44_9BILA|nr:unnamed protein product [Rotaria socialis]
MMLCDTLIQSCLFIFFSFLIYNTRGHEHHSQIDPVTTKYSQSAINVEPLSKYIETSTIQNNNFQQLNDDESLQDTIDARLLAKHNLRQSVHQDNEDDASENEEEYINKLNSALEKDYLSESQHQYESPHAIDTINKTPSQNLLKEDVQVPLRTINETRSSPTPIQTSNQRQEQTSDGLSLTEASPTSDTLIHTKTSDAELNLKQTSDKIISRVQVPSNEQKPADIVQEKVTKENVLSDSSETIPLAPLHQPTETVQAVKPANNHIPPSSNQQQPPNIITNYKLQDNELLDANTSTATPLKSDQSQQLKSDTIKNVDTLDIKPVPEAIPNDRSLDLNLKEKPSDTIKSVDSSTNKADRQQQEPSDTKHNVGSPDLEPTRTEPVQNDPPSSSTTKQQQATDKIQAIASLDAAPTRAEPVQNDPPSSSTTKQQQATDKIQAIASLDAAPTRAEPVQNDPIRYKTQCCSTIKQATDKVQAIGSPDAVPTRTEPVQNDPPSSSTTKQQQATDKIQAIASPDVASTRTEPVSNDSPLDSTAKHQPTEKIQKVASHDPTTHQQQSTPEAIPNNPSIDLNSRQQQQQPVLDATKNVESLDITVDQQKLASDKVQNSKPLDQDPSFATTIKVDQKQHVTESVEKLGLSNEQQRSAETKKDISPLDLTEKVLEKTRSIDSTDPSTSPIQLEKQPEVISTTQTTPTSIKLDKSLSDENKSPEIVQTTTPPPATTTTARILRSATARMAQAAQAAQARFRQGHQHQEQQKRQQESKQNSQTQGPTVELKSPPNVMPIIEPTISSTVNPNVESAVPAKVISTIEPTISSTANPNVESAVPAKAISASEPILSSTVSPNVESIVPAKVVLTESSTIISMIESTTQPIVEKDDDSTESLSLKPQEPDIETIVEPATDVNIDNDIPVESDKEIEEVNDMDDLPRQVHVHDPQEILNKLSKESHENEKLSVDHGKDSQTTVTSVFASDHSPHLPRIIKDEEKESTTESNMETLRSTIETINNENEQNEPLIHSDPKVDETNNSLKTNSISNNSEKILPMKYRQVCWHLPRSFESSMELIENKLLRLIDFLPEFIQTILFGRINDREKIMNTIWFGSLCTMCLLFSLLFLSMGTRRLKQSKEEKTFRARCQQLQQYNNQIELERATFEKQNQELSDQIDELKKIPVSDTDEELFELREKYERLHAEWKIARSEADGLQNDIDYKDSLIQKYEFDTQQQIETITLLNDELLRHKQELEKERETLARLQSTDLSLERFEKLQEIINELKSEISQLKQEKFAQQDQLEEAQQQANQLDIDNNELAIKMKQLKDLLEQRDETIAQIREKMLNNDDDDDEEKATELTNLLSTVTENTNENDQQELLSNVNHDIEKANQHMRNLHIEIDEKTRRIKELDALLNQEKDHCRELETKLKVVLELRERDAHLHIRQLGQTDAELRKARTDTERVRILQQQLDLKQKQLEDVQKVLTIEQSKFSEDSGKLQHEIHEKWMEVKRLTRELDGARKECESLRKQITKYAHSERSSLEKTMHRPIPQHMNNTNRLSNEQEINSSSPPLPHPYQQGDNFRPIDHERNESGAASPAEMLRIRPPMFGPPRVPFFPPPFMGPPNPFMMGPRFPMSVGGPHGMLSPISHLITNGSAGGSDANSFEIVDSANITPNSTSYDAQLNGSAVSPVPNGDEDQTAVKPKKPKKSTKKKTKTSITSPPTQEV